MRKLTWLAAVGVIATPMMAQAQQRTPEDYVCLLTGRCGPEAGSAAPPESGPGKRFALATAPAAPVDLRLTFASGSAALSATAQREARALAAALARPALAVRRLRIEGHTDSAGRRATNLALSQRRAAAVVAYLATQGVARARLTAIGYGSGRPLPDLPPGAAANRRVVAILLP
ncbi:MAG: hypothetical protein JWN21_1292 [Sphingomonas bacterium]|uniref:OmpA family protein n=1 Tax=Sphingomonas bacterium TaxID=1895847 RepID=UPI0026082B3F|nr:OmpA family protein [Sphingomonas bacterium]MDB5695749.1 hypothetical protein [Sphingomonas bacterium]